MTTQKTTNPVATRTRAVDRSRTAAAKQTVEVARPQTAPTEDGVEAAPSAAQLRGNVAVPAVLAATAPPPIAPAVPSDDLASTQPEAVPLTPAIDIVTGTIGGVGKTQFAHLLTSYYYDRMLKFGHLQPIHLVEGDHKGTKFYKSYQRLPEPFSLMTAGVCQTVLSDDPDQRANADIVMQLVEQAQAPVVVNTPANCAEAVNGWLTNSHIPRLCQEAGIPLRYWFVCVNTDDSLGAFVDSMSTVGEIVPHILVQNHYLKEGQGAWDLPDDMQRAVEMSGVPVIQMKPLFIQNQKFSNNFYLPFPVAGAYNIESFSVEYWQGRVVAEDWIITRWLEWTGGTLEEFTEQWRDYWQNRKENLAYALDEAAYQDYLRSIQHELSSRQSTLSKAWSQAHQQQFMTRYGIPIASVGNNRVRTFMTDLHEAIAAQGLA